MKLTFKITSIVLFIAVAFAFSVSIFTAFPVFSSAPSGLPAKQTIATTTEVGPQETIAIFSSKASCSSRVISTTDGLGQAIQILFGDPVNGDISSTSISEVVGHLQAGSTTVMYDSGLYGCGRWIVDSSASTTLLLSEFN